MYDLIIRVLNWIAAHPDDEPGFIVLVAQLQVLAARLAQVITEQRNGLIDSRASRSRKQEVRREMLAVPIAHLARRRGGGSGVCSPARTDHSSSTS